MPIAPTYPGVYIEELPSGVRTITGVATSITAFVGRALRGPSNEALTINSFADFERTFGGLWVDSALSFAVRDFFQNGGSQAIIVRVHNGGAAATITLPGGGTLVAVSEGLWGERLRARVDHNTRDTSDTTLYNLAIRDTGTGAEERFLNISTDSASPRSLDRVLERGSSLVRVSGSPPATRPTASTAASPGADPFADSAPASSFTQANADGDDGSALTGALVNGSRAAKTGLFALEKAELFNLLNIPPYLSTGDVDTSVIGAAAAYCEERRAMLLVDPPSDWDSVADAIGDPTASPPTGVSGVGTSSKNAALFFPRLREPNPLRDNQMETVAPGGAIAGIFARTDAQRGVWKAPAGLDAVLNGVPDLSVKLSDPENGQLNPLGINCLRSFPGAGRVVWGSRTLQGNDRLASEWKYVPVRRLALYIEESLYRGTQWVVFEPNDEPLWAQIRLNLGAFMQNLFQQGAFQGRSPREAYFVKCDKETTTQNDINLGIVNILVGFAPLKPAEFVIIKIQQMAGQVQA